MFKRGLKLMRTVRRVSIHDSKFGIQFPKYTLSSVDARLFGGARVRVYIGIIDELRRARLKWRSAAGTSPSRTGSASFANWLGPARFDPYVGWHTLAGTAAS
jgi:hypothetical protein